MSKFIREYDEDMKTAMITGGTTVLGVATAKMLLEAGFRVVLHDSDMDALTKCIDEMGALASENCYPICFDPTSPEIVEEGFTRIERDFYPVYILVNNAGVLSNSLSSQTTYEQWRGAFSQNVDSAFLISKAALPTMRKRKWGRIINTCSLAGKTGGVTTGVAYSSSKGALHTLTFALAREVAGEGITVNGIAPAYIRTPAVEGYPQDMLDMLLKYIPVGRFCEPEEFAFCVKYLCSPLAGFVCGELIDLNGGLLMS